MTSSGGGVNVGAAILGGLVAGTAGAILAGREATTVNTHYIKQGERYMELYYYDDNNNTAMMVLPYEVYTILKNNYSDKDYDVVKIQGSKTEAPKAEKSVDTIDKIAELKKLLDLGAITNEEYESKKTELLSRL